jgi:hypothetical protein
VLKSLGLAGLAGLSGPAVAAADMESVQEEDNIFSDDFEDGTYENTWEVTKKHDVESVSEENGIFTYNSPIDETIYSPDMTVITKESFTGEGTHVFEAEFQYDSYRRMKVFRVLSQNSDDMIQVAEDAFAGPDDGASFELFLPDEKIDLDSNLGSNQWETYKLEIDFDENRVVSVTRGDETYDVDREFSSDFSDYRLGFGEGNGVSRFESISISSGSSSEKPTVTVNITDDEHTKVVQSVTNTQIRNGDTTDISDPSIVADAPASIALGVSWEGFNELPDDAKVSVPFTVRKEGTNPSQNEFTLTQSDLAKIENQPYPVKNLSEAFNDENQPPIFTLTEDTRSITITVERVETEDYIIEEDELTLEKGTDFRVVPMPTLDIGVTTVKFPESARSEDGDGYGDPEKDGAFSYSDEYDSPLNALSTSESGSAFITQLKDYLEEEYPVVEVNVNVTSELIRGNPIQSIGQYLDYHRAYDLVYQEYPDVDVALLIVPNDGDGESDNNYYKYHNKDALGLEVAGKDIQPQMAASVVWEPSSQKNMAEISAMEIGHHFLPWDAYSGRYTYDGNHVNPDPDPSDSPEVKSTDIDLSDEERNYDVETASVSFMCNDDDYDNHASDSRTHEKLIDSSFDPQPPDTDVLGSSTRLLTGSIDIGTPTGPVLYNTQLKDGFPLPSVDNSDITVRVLDGANELLVEKALEVIQPLHQHDEGEDTELAQMIVSFGDTAAEIEIETADSQTTVDPVSGVLSELIANLPTNAFKNNSENRRSTLQSKLDQVEKMMGKQNYRPAANKLENDILDKFEKWLVDTDSEAANIPSKQDVIDQCNEMIDHVEGLAEEFGQGRGNERVIEGFTWICELILTGSNRRALLSSF